MCSALRTVLAALPAVLASNVNFRANRGVLNQPLCLPTPFALELDLGHLGSISLAPQVFRYAASGTTIQLCLCDII